MENEETLEQEIQEATYRGAKRALSEEDKMEFPAVQDVHVTNFPEQKEPVFKPEITVQPTPVQIIKEEHKSEVIVEKPDLSELISGIKSLNEGVDKLLQKESLEFDYSEFERIAKENKSTYRGGGVSSTRQFLDTNGNKINPATSDNQTTANTHLSDISGNIEAQSVASTLNTTTQTLSSGATYSGTFELNNYSDAQIWVLAEGSATLYIEFSPDGGTTTDQFPFGGIELTAGIPFYDHVVVGQQSFRIRVENTSGADNDIITLVAYGNFGRPNSTLGTAIGAKSGTIAVRNANDHKLDIARGFIGGQTGIHKFGANPNITASSTEDIIFTGTINWLQTASAVRIKSGGHASDASGGVGARSITVVGLDENWNEATEDITTNGSSVSSATTTTFIRVFRAYVKDVGTYTGNNVGDIAIESTGGTTLVTIPATRGQTQTSAYTVPAGKTAYMTRLQADSTTTKASDVRFWQRRNADDVTVPFSGKRLIQSILGLSGNSSASFDAYPSFPAKTDIWASATTSSGGAGAVAVDYDLILVDN